MKQRMNILLSCLLTIFCSSVTLYADEQSSRIIQLDKLSDTTCKNLIKQLYTQAVSDAFEGQLPKDFQVVAKALLDGADVQRAVLEDALSALGDFLGSRVPRPNGGMPVGPGCCCDLTQIERLLGIIRSCCADVAECCANLTATVISDFNETWTILREIQELEELKNHCPTILTSSQILPNGYTITTAGYYTLCGSIGFDAPGTSTCVIRIQASNVTLDFNQHTIYQVDADANLNGVCVDAGFDNIVIKSGKISGVSASGITVANGSQDIIISDMTVRGCGGAGISFSGTTGSRNRDVIIEDSTFNNNSGNGGTFVFTEKVTISDSKFNDNVVIGASFVSSNGNEITNSTFNKNGGAGDAIGLSLNATGSSIVRDCIFSANFSTTGTARGLLLTSTGNLVENCVADGNSSTVSAGFALGFDVDGTAHLLNNCTASANSAVAGAGSTGAGVRLVSTAFRCLVRNSTAVTNSARGFEHDATDTYNIFIGNFSFGHGTNTNNYFGSGLGFISVGAGAQPPTGSFDERSIDNISVV